ncbi:MAG: hypothetical protein KatS3mg038_3511 [Candidatus Kapaibacterium sp.]|nr:MAG: hypothetical protein KatS3mg038_3511 [Candidatus Kapabacteria bacterium]
MRLIGSTTQTQQPSIEVILPRLHRAQREVARCDARFVVLAAGRRWGKTLLGATLCARVALSGGRAWWVAPSYPMARVGWRAMRRIAEQIPLIEVRQAERCIVVPGGGEMWVRSADDPHSLRGEGLDYVVMDECAYMREEAWSQVLRPALSDRKGRALMISTPNGLNWWYELWRDVQQRGEWRTLSYPTASNPHIDSSEIEEARRELPELVYRQEYLAEFVDLEGASLLRRAWLRYYDELPQMDVVSIGVDLAISRKTTADYTAIAVVGRRGDCIYILDIVRDRMTMQETLAQVQQLAERYNASDVAVESVGYQQVVADQLARTTTLRVRSVKPTTDKITRATPLAAKYEQGLVYHPRSASWLRAYEDELLAFPVGEHDDQIDAVAYALQHLYSRVDAYSVVYV